MKSNKYEHLDVFVFVGFGVLSFLLVAGVVIYELNFSKHAEMIKMREEIKYIELQKKLKDLKNEP